LHSRYKSFLDINVPYLYSYYTNMIDKFLNDFKQNPNAEKHQNVSIAKAFETDDYGCGIRSKAEDIHAYSEGRRRSPEKYDIINIIAKFDPSEQIEKDSFVVSRIADFLHSVRHNYHKELIFEVVIGGYPVWSTTIPPNSIEWIFGGMPLLLINIQFSIVRFIIRDDEQIVCTNQLQLYLYHGAIIDSSYRRFIAQNPPYCYVKERSYLHTNYVVDAEHGDILVKHNQIFYPHSSGFP
jgi:hypothetical protein